MVAVPNTRVRMSHALTIRSGGRIIGAIHQWSASQAREVDTEYEVEANGVGRPVDLVPQNLTRREVRIARYDTYPEIMEEVFGSSELITLCDQSQPFRCREVWKGPSQLGSPLGAGSVALSEFSSAANFVGASGAAATAARAQGAIVDATHAAAMSSVGGPTMTALGFLTSDIRMYEYQGCWFTDLGRVIDAKGDRVISVEATMVWLSRVRVA